MGSDREPVYAFDAYGTLLDVGSAVARQAGAVGPDAARLSELWRAKQLEYTWVLSLLGRHEPFWDLTARALDYALAALPSVDRALREPLLDAYRHLAAYPEVVGVLATLRDRGARTAVLSNGNAAMLEEALHAAGLTPLLDRIVSVDEVGVFKTSPLAYGLLTSGFGVPADRVIFASSNRWDVAGAAAVGMRTIWVNRTGSPDEYLDLAPVARFVDVRGVLTIS
jgi:2-haloacid dehalogenase